MTDIPQTQRVCWSPVTGEFPAQKASNALKVSIWWRHHVYAKLWLLSYIMYHIIHHMVSWIPISIIYLVTIWATKIDWILDAPIFRRKRLKQKTLLTLKSLPLPVFTFVCHIPFTNECHSWLLSYLWTSSRVAQSICFCINARSDFSAFP